jgi:hypothetical protein|eukprot:COSAG06_NODE_5754_length_3292_cov_4.642343_1_plen_80_part_00
MTTSLAALPSSERNLMSEIDLDSSVAGMAGQNVDENGIVIQASSTGLASANLTIPVSLDAATDDVLVVAASSVGKLLQF